MSCFSEIFVVGTELLVGRNKTLKAKKNIGSYAWDL